jgi:hypothetical protein
MLFENSIMDEVFTERVIRSWEITEAQEERKSLPFYIRTSDWCTNDLENLPDPSVWLTSNQCLKICLRITSVLKSSSKQESKHRVHCYSTRWYQELNNWSSSRKEATSDSTNVGLTSHVQQITGNGKASINPDIVTVTNSILMNFFVFPLEPVNWEPKI